MSRLSAIVVLGVLGWVATGWVPQPAAAQLSTGAYLPPPPIAPHPGLPILQPSLEAPYPALPAHLTKSQTIVDWSTRPVLDATSPLDLSWLYEKAAKQTPMTPGGLPVVSQLCPHCQQMQPPVAPGAHLAEPGRFPLDPNEPAKELLEIVEKTNPEIFDGMLNRPAVVGDRHQSDAAEGHRQETREAFVQAFRQLDAEERSRGATVTVSAEEPLSPGPAKQPSHPAAVDALRMASRQLDQAAQVLEDQRLYTQADELWEMSRRLRLEARAAGQSQRER